MTLAVTTSRDAEPALIARARAVASRWGVPYVARARTPLPVLLAKGAEVLIVLSRDSVELWDREGHFRFSPGMAALRLGRLAGQDAANPDRIVAAAELREGDAVLDCTMGLAQDALVIARAVGPKGRVVAVEASLPIHAVVSEGLAIAAQDPSSARIEPVHADALGFLRALPDASFDVVFFDPMFDRPRKANPVFDVLRRYADPSPITAEHIQEGRRVAKRSVVFKSARHSDALKRLGMEPLPGSRYADVVFGRVAARGR